MKILHCLDSWNIGGIQEMVRLMAKYSKHHHDAKGYKGTMTPYMDEVGIETYESNPAARYDVVVGHTVGGWSHDHLFQWARSKGARTVEVMHSIYQSPTNPYYVDEFVAVSHLALGVNTHMPRRRCIYPIAEVNSFQEPEGPYIGRVSRLAHEKRPDVFVNLAVDFPHEKFLLGGGGAMYEMLKARNTPNLEMPGWIRDFPEFFKRLKLFVFPTQDECCCMSVAMAQCAGIPVICQDLPALRETTGGYAAFCTHIGTFSLAIEDYLRNPNASQDQTARAKGWARITFDTIEQWDDLWEELWVL